MAHIMDHRDQLNHLKDSQFTEEDHQDLQTKVLDNTIDNLKVKKTTTRTTTVDTKMVEMTILHHHLLEVMPVVVTDNLHLKKMSVIKEVIPMNSPKIIEDMQLLRDQENQSDLNL